VYIDGGEINIGRTDMALQIANPTVIQKIEALARKTGLTKTASVERAVDSMLSENVFQDTGVWDRFDAILGQLDRVPESPSGVDVLEWDAFGLPR
jgi:antitoxin VapB